jgi:hypothetical protein
LFRQALHLASGLPWSSGGNSTFLTGQKCSTTWSLRRSSTGTIGVNQGHQR